jgi:hypothetical protein
VVPLLFKFFLWWTKRKFLSKLVPFILSHPVNLYHKKPNIMSQTRIKSSQTKLAQQLFALISRFCTKAKSLFDKPKAQLLYMWPPRRHKMFINMLAGRQMRMDIRFLSEKVTRAGGTRKHAFKMQNCSQRSK